MTQCLRPKSKACTGEKWVDPFRPRTCAEDGEDFKVRKKKSACNVISRVCYLFTQENRTVSECDPVSRQRRHAPAIFVDSRFIFLHFVPPCECRTGIGYNPACC
ncbi:unnamed protein product [Sphacelaria rigidula]